WRASLNSARLAYLQDHQVEGSPLLPAAAYIEMGIAAARETLGGSAAVVTDAEFRAPLLLSSEEDTFVEVAVTRDSSEAASFRIFSHRDAADGNGRTSWTLHASGRIHSSNETPTGTSPEPNVLDVIRARCPQEIPVEHLYQRLAQNGLQYGGRFR